MKNSFIILSGGRSSRFGSDKSEIVFAGQTLINRLVESLPDGEIVVVGPSFEGATRPVTFTREDPIGSGPVAAIVAGLQEITSETVIVLAVDMPFAGELIPALLSASLQKDGLIPEDHSGQLQPLCAIYRTSALRLATLAMGDVVNKSMNALLSKVNSDTLKVDSNLTSKLVDIDTQSDLEKVLEIYNERDEK